MAHHQQPNAVMAAPGKVAITAASFRAKYNSKREVYNFLAVDVGIYLPAYGKCPNHSILTLLFVTYRAGDHLLFERFGPRKEEK